MGRGSDHVRRVRRLRAGTRTLQDAFVRGLVYGVVEPDTDRGMNWHPVKIAYRDPGRVDCLVVVGVGLSGDCHGVKTHRELLLYLAAGVGPGISEFPESARCTSSMWPWSLRTTASAVGVNELAGGAVDRGRAPHVWPQDHQLVHTPRPNLYATCPIIAKPRKRDMGFVRPMPAARA
jgi:hypothetical protein